MSTRVEDAYLFTHLSADQLRRVRAMSHSLSLNEGDALFRIGNPATRFFLVRKGRIKLYRVSPDGNEKVFEIIQPGHTIAEALMFLEHPCYPVSADALSASELLAIENQPFLSLLRESVDTCFMLLGAMSQRLHNLIQEIDNLTLQTATSRTAAILISHLSNPGQKDFRLCAPKSVLASRCSVKPETFSRILHNLSAQGVISVRGSCITVHAADRLRLLASAGCPPAPTRPVTSAGPCTKRALNRGSSD